MPWKSCTISINLCSIFSLFLFSIDGYSDIDARMVVRKYIEKGSGVTLYCEHNVDPKILYKVSISTGWYSFYRYVNEYLVSLFSLLKNIWKTRNMLERIEVTIFFSVKPPISFHFCLFFFVDFLFFLWCVCRMHIQNAYTDYNYP